MRRRSAWSLSTCFDFPHYYAYLLRDIFGIEETEGAYRAPPQAIPSYYGETDEVEADHDSRPGSQRGLKVQQPPIPDLVPQLLHNRNFDDGTVSSTAVMLDRL